MSVFCNVHVGNTTHPPRKSAFWRDCSSDLRQKCIAGVGSVRHGISFDSKNNVCVGNSRKKTASTGVSHAESRSRSRCCGLFPGNYRHRRCKNQYSLSRVEGSSTFAMARKPTTFDQTLKRGLHSVSADALAQMLNRLSHCDAPRALYQPNNLSRQR